MNDFPSTLRNLKRTHESQSIQKANNKISEKMNQMQNKLKTNRVK